MMKYDDLMIHNTVVLLGLILFDSDKPYSNSVSKPKLNHGLNGGQTQSFCPSVLSTDSNFSPFTETN